MNDIEIFSVNEINSHIKNILENNIPFLYVEGEISNFVKHTSGHIYFSIKDQFSTIRCVFFRQNNYALEFFPSNGDKVILYGRITLYVKGGNYQFNVNTMFNSGRGILQIKFEQLKRKLQLEGLFEEEHKLPIPKYPKVVGVITSATGAALQDIKNVIFRRFPVELVVFPATMQGEKSSREVVKGINYFETNRGIDVLIISRGGGSQDDLFVFNEENIARAIYDCSIPIITGIGHEIDFTIADFVADLRAPTPSAAAEVAVPDKGELLNTLSKIKKSLDLNVNSIFSKRERHLMLKKSSLAEINIEANLNNQRNKLNQIIGKYEKIGLINDYLNQKLSLINQRLNHSFSEKSTSLLSSEKYKLTNLLQRLDSGVQQHVQNQDKELELLSTRLRMQSPKRILDKGYAYVTMNKEIVSTAANLDIGDIIDIRFANSSVEAKIIKPK